MSGQSNAPRRRSHPQVEDLYRLLVENVRDYAIITLDPAGHITSWNAGAERIKGYAAEEVVGQHYRVLFPKAAREAGVPEKQLEVAKRDGRCEGEGWRRRKDGQQFWAHVVVTTLYDGDKAVGFGKVTGDMTAERAAKQEVLRRERQLAEAQAIARLGNWEYEMESGEIHPSPQLYDILGLDPESAVGYDEAMDRVHPEDREAVASALAALLDNGTPFVHDHRIERPDGEVRWVQSRGEPMRDESGTIVRLLGTIQDITEMREADQKARRLATEKAAREEAERTAQRMGFLAQASALLGTSLEYEETLRTVSWLAIPSFADWCAVDMVDPDGHLRRLAVAHPDEDRLKLAEQVHEEYPPDPEGSRIHQVLRDRTPLLIEEVPREMLEERARDARHLEILLALAPVSVIIVPIEVRGHSLGAITFAYAESDRRYTEDDLMVAGELASRAGLAIENAHLHRAEQSARERAERASERTTRLQAITGGLSEAVTPEAVAEVMVEEGASALDAVNGSLVLLRPDGSLEMVRSIGLPPEVVEHFSQLDVDAGVPLAEAIRTGKLVIVEDLADEMDRYPAIADIQGTTGTRAMVAVPLQSGSGVTGALAFGYDRNRPFTEEDQRFLLALGRQCAQALERAWLYETEHLAREAAEAANRAKSQFVAMMSHELRTPLSAIIGYQELLSEGISGPINANQKEQLDRIRASATHLRDVINQILSLSRIEAGKEEVEAEDVDVAQLVREVAALMERDIDGSGIELVLDVSEDEVRMTTDPGKIRQITMNLLSNAMKFTDEGTITVRLEPTEDELRLAIDDTGVGIEPQDQEKIFEAFTQVDQSMTRRAGGSGLGLAVSRRLAELLEGRLEVESEPGVGSTFTLIIPR